MRKTRNGRSSSRRRLRVTALGALVVGAVLCGAIAKYWAEPQGGLENGDGPRRVLAAIRPPAQEQQVSPSEVVRPARPEIVFPFLPWAEIHATAVAGPTMLRLRENDRIFVLLFPDLAAQAAMLNRLAALIEKASLPRDRIVSHDELAETIARGGETAERWYLGHDYAGAAIARFFAIAARDGVALSAEEKWLRDRFQAARASVPAEAEIAVISAPNVGDGIDPEMRRAIVDHEIGHGFFFTRPDIAVHVLDVWRRRFRDDQRRAIAAFLSKEGYDTDDEMLMANEAMAYLLFTPDRRFFDAATLGISEQALAEMRAIMRQGFPWPDEAPTGLDLLR
jgi:hypothetical protein